MVFAPLDSIESLVPFPQLIDTSVVEIVVIAVVALVELHIYGFALFDLAPNLASSVSRSLSLHIKATRLRVRSADSESATSSSFNESPHLLRFVIAFRKMHIGAVQTNVLGFEAEVWNKVALNLAIRIHSKALVGRAMARVQLRIRLVLFLQLMGCLPLGPFEV